MNVISRNRKGVIHNDYQNIPKFKRVLTVCSAGCLRSPTAAHILSADPWNFNTRAAGISSEYAIVHADPGLVLWADEIVVMDNDHAFFINETQKFLDESTRGFEIYNWKPVHILNVPDNYDYRNPELVKIMTDKFREIWPI